MLLTCAPKTSLRFVCGCMTAKGYLKSVRAVAVAARLTLRGPMAHTNGSDLSPAHLNKVLNWYKSSQTHTSAAASGNMGRAMPACPTGPNCASKLVDFSLLSHLGQLKLYRCAFWSCEIAASL